MGSGYFAWIIPARSCGCVILYPRRFNHGNTWKYHIHSWFNEASLKQRVSNKLKSIRWSRTPQRQCHILATSTVRDGGIPSFQIVKRTYGALFKVFVALFLMLDSPYLVKVTIYHPCSLAEIAMSVAETSISAGKFLILENSSSQTSMNVG